MSTINNSNAAALKTRRWFTLAIFVFFGIVAILWFIVLFVTHESKPKLAAQAPAQTICPDMSALEARSCLITSEWSHWIKFADAQDKGKSMCFERKMAMESKEEDGLTLWRFKSEGGPALQKYRLSQSCSWIVF